MESGDEFEQFLSVATMGSRTGSGSHDDNFRQSQTGKNRMRMRASFKSESAFHPKTKPVSGTELMAYRMKKVQFQHTESDAEQTPNSTQTQSVGPSQGQYLTLTSSPDKEQMSTSMRNGSSRDLVPDNVDKWKRSNSMPSQTRLSRPHFKPSFEPASTDGLTELCEEPPANYYRVRRFSTANKDIINIGDSLKIMKHSVRGSVKEDVDISRPGSHPEARTAANQDAGHDSTGSNCHQAHKV